MSGQRKPVLSGGCQCGAVRYALYAMPERSGICHCRMCQKAVGGPFFAWAAVNETDIAWTRGAPSLFASSSAAERGFCASCGTPLTFRYRRRPEHIDVTIGSLDDPVAVTPRLVMGIESRLDWCAALLPGAPASATGEASPPEDLTKIAIRQHPDHDTEPEWRPPGPS
jgi:hypothetical protein